jgi:hypothetical protein
VTIVQVASAVILGVSAVDKAFYLRRKFGQASSARAADGE